MEIRRISFNIQHSALNSQHSRFFALLLLVASCSHAPARTPERFDKPDAAAEYYAMKRTAPEGRNPQALYDAARAHMNRMPRFVARTDSIPDDAIRSWKFLGPGNIGGRVRALLIDDRDPDTMYAAGISGGIWKTTDGGAQWQPVGDVLANLDVSSLAFDPDDHDVIYAGTGEGYFREDVRGTKLPLRGNGIYVTRNGGAAWSRLQSTTGEDFYWVNDLVVSSHDSRRIYAATRTGVWRSLDSGETWTRAVATTVKGGCLDLAFRGDTASDFLFASCGVFEQASVYRSKRAETSDPWTVVLNEPGMSRTSLAIAPSNPSVVYALAASNRLGPQNTTQNLQAVYRSDHDGDAGSWQARATSKDAEKLNTILLSNPYSALEPQCRDINSTDSGDWVPMGWHCNVIAVDPRNADRVWAAGVDLFRSEDGGKTWGVVSYWWTGSGQTSFVHADQHVIVFDPRYDGVSNQTLFAANDGGIYRTSNANGPILNGTRGACSSFNSGVEFKSLNHNLGVTQFYRGAVFPDGKTFFGGAQDNGTVVGTAGAGPAVWDRYWSGDGGYVAVDPANTSILYLESQYGEIVRYDGANFVDAAATIRGRDNFLFITPFELDRNDSTRLWTGGTQLWRSAQRGSNWTPASAPVNGQVTSIAIGLQHAGRVLAGTTNGDIVRNDAAWDATPETTWSPAHPRNGFVSSVIFDPDNDDIAYATYALFGGGAHVWKSIDGGATWNSIDGAGDGALPDIPTHSLAIDPTLPSRLYLGTDLGIFVTNDGGATWTTENTGFAPVITEHVLIAQGERGPAIYAFTHGRGAWRAELVPPKRRRAVR